VLVLVSLTACGCCSSSSGSNVVHCGRVYARHPKMVNINTCTSVVVHYRAISFLNPIDGHFVSPSMCCLCYELHPGWIWRLVQLSAMPFRVA
jgi:hypothetical protein